MDVKFVDEGGVETKRTMVARCDGETHPLVRLQQQQQQGERTQPHGGRCLEKGRLGRAVGGLALSMGGELVGTFLLTLVICSVVSSSVLSSAQTGLWQVAVVCGLGVAVSIYCTSYISDAHLNPAITLAFAVVRRTHFSWKRVGPYILAQMVGGVLAGGVLYAFSSEAIALYETERGIERGDNASVITAMMFGEYFPNPALYDHSDPDSLRVASMLRALAVEAWTTSILAFVIFSLTDESNTAVVGGGGGKGGRVVVPLVIGLTVSILISLYGPYTQVGMNPARDLGPRLVAACAGWGAVAIPGPRRGFWVYVVGPLLGAVLGAALSGLVISRGVKVVGRWREREREEGQVQLSKSGS